MRGITKSKGVVLGNVFLVIAVGLSGWLAYNALTESLVAGCGGEGGCGKVLKSKWAAVLEVPTSLLGVFLYSALLIVSQVKSTLKPFLLSLLSTAVIGGALWFTYIQVRILGYYCPYCCAIHLIATIGAVLSCEKGLSKSALKVGSACGAALVVGVICLQVYGPEQNRSVVIKAFPTVSEVTIQPEKHIQEGLDIESLLLVPYRAAPHHPMRLAINGGALIYDKNLLPQISLGVSEPTSKTPATQLLYLFDWTCDHCRALHQKLDTLSYGKKPLGLDGQYDISLLPAYTDSKGKSLHMFMMAAYKEDLAVYHELAVGLYDGVIEATPNAVREKALELVGADRWNHFILRNASKVNLALSLGEFQMAKNEGILGIGTFPQLTGIDTAIAGMPSDKALKEFLITAAETQNRFLENTPEGLPIPRFFSGRTRQASRPESSRLGGGKSALPERNKSEISFQEKEVTTPSIKVGEKMTAMFSFTNTGTDPLTILNLKTGCGCTYSSGWQQTVAPGESGSFKVTYNSANKSRYGPHTRKIWVTSTAENFENELFGNEIKMIIPIHDENGNPSIRPNKLTPVPAKERD